MLVSSKDLLKAAQKGRYAIGAFNVENMEMAQAVIMASEKMNAPVLIQTTPGTLNYAPPSAFAGVVSRLARDAKTPIALHLDHGNSVELCKECMKEGYTSIMIDGSLLPFEENIALVKEVTSIAGDITVEGELGTVGGKEDTHEASVQYTDPAQAKIFVEETGIDIFAPAIGTAHGVYASTPKLDVERLSEIANVVSVPLVLHGTTGVPAESVRECISRGICKVNYATELRITFSDAVKKYLAENPKAFDPKKYLAAGRTAVMERVCELITLCGSEGKA